MEPKTEHIYAVIFRSIRTEHSEDLYQEHAAKMEKLVKNIKGYISHHGQRDPITREGITISYFESLEAIKEWRENAEHQLTQELGRTHFYESYEVKIVKVEREYQWEKK
jgi:heme-degrading monooxygenase HmoA